MVATTDWTVAGITGGLIMLGGSVGGVVVWMVRTKRESRKNSIDEYQTIINEMRSQHKIDLEQRDTRIKDLENQRRSYKEIANEAIEVTEREVNAKRASQGKGPFAEKPSIVPEHNSPVAMEQQETADLQTVRARITAVKVALELPAREPGEPETDSQRIERIKSELKERDVQQGIESKPALQETLLKVKEDVAAMPDKVADKVAEKNQPT